VTRAEVEDACRAALVKICMYVVSSITVMRKREKKNEYIRRRSRTPAIILVHFKSSRALFLNISF
jgi:hypothetical protein